MTAAGKTLRCYCPDDCNCRKPWRRNYCGCTQHASISPDGDVWRQRASEALCDALEALAASHDIPGWRLASDLETRSLWRVAIRLPEGERLMTEQQAWQLVRERRRG